jgi:hypothetical protein
VKELGVGGTIWNGVGMWLDLVRAPLPDPATPSPVRFLRWDATLLAHARRTQILPGTLPVADLPHEDAALALA